MVTINNIFDCKIEKSVIALGKFDGIHLGHQKIIEELKDNEDKELKTVVITFSVSPEAVLSHKDLKYIMTEQEKNTYFEELGIDYLIDIKLNYDFLNLTADDFVDKYLVKNLGMKKVVCGNDFRFGKDRQGNTEFLKEKGRDLGFTVRIVEHVNFEHAIISSTFIREKISMGDLVRANKMLGHNFSISGVVIHGNQIGRTINFPTINIIPPTEKILPANGVYVSTCMIDGVQYKCVTNIGMKPTVSDAHIVIVETHILNYNGDLYGRELTVELLEFVRPEMKFSSLGELRNQIAADRSLVDRF